MTKNIPLLSFAPDMGRIKDETLNGAKWQIVQRFTMQPLQFLYGVLLARLLTPDEFGVLGLTSVFFSVAAQLQSCGMGTALIRKQDRTELDCNTVFWFNVAISAFFALAFCIAAPFFALYFGIPDLCPLTIVSALMMFISSTGSVHYTLYTAKRQFRIPALVNMAGALISIPLTLVLAYAGFSYWSLTIGGVTSGLVTLAIIWYISPWKPRFAFSWKSFNDFFFFGVKITATNIITNLYDGAREIIIGKLYSPAQLAYFGKAFGTCSLPIGIVDGIWRSVALPVLSTIQDDDARLIHAYRQYIKVAAFLMQWGMLTLAANAYAILYTLYGEQWLPCIPYMQILCFGIMFNPMTFINQNIYIVKGRTDILLYREIIFRVFGITALIVGAFYGVTGICYAAMASGMFCFTVSIFMTQRIIPFKALDQCKDFMPYMLLAVLVNIPSYYINQMDISPYIMAPMGVGLSGLLYVGVLFLMQDPTLFMLINLVFEKLHLKWRVGA